MANPWGGQLEMVAQCNTTIAVNLCSPGLMAARRPPAPCSSTRSSDGLLDFSRSVLGDGDVAGQGRGKCNPLRPTQFEHGLHVFAKKRRFHRQVIRDVRLNQGGAPVKNPLQLDRVVFVLGEVQRTHLHQFHLFAADPYHAVPHDGGAGVDAQYDLFRRGLGAGLEGMLRRRYIWKCVFATSSPRRPWATSPGH